MWRSKANAYPFRQSSSSTAKEILGIYDSSVYLHVGDDYSSDVEGAHNAGWKSVLISSNFSLPPKGKKAPDICVSSMKELYLLFKSVLDTFVVC